MFYQATPSLTPSTPSPLTMNLLCPAQACTVMRKKKKKKHFPMFFLHFCLHNVGTCSEIWAQKSAKYQSVNHKVKITQVSITPLVTSLSLQLHVLCITADHLPNFTRLFFFFFNFRSCQIKKTFGLSASWRFICDKDVYAVKSRANQPLLRKWNLA